MVSLPPRRDLCFAAALVFACGGEANGGPPASPTGGSCGAQSACAGAGGTGAGGTSGNASGAAGASCSADTAAQPSAWATWPMPHPPGSGLPHAASYDVRADTVVDNVTGLMWQRAGSSDLSFDEAESHCEDLELDAHCDWRLPNRIELVSLVDFTRTSPAIDTAAFPDTRGEYYSSSALAGYRWRIGADGSTRSLTDAQAPTARARCVRRHVERESPDPHYAIAGQSPDDLVSDRGTGLVWQRQLSSASYTFAEAQAYCEALTIDGGGYRVPSMKELQTLLDETRDSPPLIDAQAFPGFPETASPTFWTSSPSVRSSDAAWFVRGAVTLESAVDANTQAQFYVRCVR